MLFALSKISDEQEKSMSGAVEFPGDHAYPGSFGLADCLDLVADGKCIHWVSDGGWSMHDMLMGLLDKTGPADVYLSSYAFSEYPARLIADLKSRAVIRDLFCLIDKRLDVRSASALTIIRNVATRLKLVHTHSKVTVIENENAMIVVIGSANYTTNKRYETGVIIFDRDAALFHKKWMLHALNDGK